MTPEELVASLAPVRVPESFARFGLQDAFAAVALGLVAGLLLSAVLRVVTRRRPRRRHTRVDTRRGEPFPTARSGGFSRDSL